MGGFSPLWTQFDAGVIEIQMHLPDVGVGERAGLEIDDEDSADTVKEQQIDAEPFVVDSQSLLPSDEGEVVAEFQEKGFQVLDEGSLRDRSRSIRPSSRGIREPTGSGPPHRRTQRPRDKAYGP